MIKKKDMTLFTGREENITLFNSYLDKVLESDGSDKKHYIIKNYGIGGIGKSCLISKYVEIIHNKNGEKKGTKVVFCDFDSFYLQEKFIINMMLQLSNQFGNSNFYCTKFAYYTLKEKFNVEYPFNDDFKKKGITDNKIYDTTVAVIKFVTSAGKYIDFIHRIYSILFKKEKKISYESMLKKFKKNIGQDRVGLDLIDAVCCSSKEEIYNDLGEYFCYDLSRLMKESKQSLVVFIDTYENYSVGTEKNARKIESLLTSMMETTSKTLWVISGRKNVEESGGRFEKWKSLGTIEDQLEPLNRYQMEEYFKKAEIDSSLWSHFAEISKGIPFVLSLLYESYVEKYNDEVQEADDISRYNNQRYTYLQPEGYGCSYNEILERYFDTKDESQKNLFKILSVLENGWSDEIVEFLSEKLKGFNNNTYEIVKRSSSINKNNSGKYYIAEDLRSLILSFTEKTIKESVHSIMLEYYQNKLDEGCVSVDIVYQYCFYADEEQIEMLLKDKILQYAKEKLELKKYDEVQLILSCFLNTLEKSDNEPLKIDYFYILFSCSKNLENYRQMKTCANNILPLVLECTPTNIKIMEELQSFFTDLEPDKALEIQQKIYLYYLRQYGEDNPKTLVQLMSRCHLLLNLGLCSEALQIAINCCEKSRKQTGNDRTIYYVALNNVGKVLLKMGKYNEALDINKRCYNDVSELLGDQDSFTLTCLYDLGMNLLGLNENEQALDIFRKCYLQREIVLGKYNYDTILSQAKIGEVLQIIGKNKEALEIIKNSSEKAIQTLGEFNPFAIICMVNLGIAFEKTGEYDKAAEIESECYKKACIIFGEESAISLQTLFNYGFSLVNIGLFKKALEIYEKHNDICIRIYGEKDINTLKSFANTCAVLSRLGQHQKVLEICNKYYSISKETLGEMHSLTLTFLLSLGISHDHLGEKEKALEIARDCYKKRSESLGEKNPDTIYSLKFMLSLLSEQNNSQELLCYRKKLFELSCDTDISMFQY